MSDVAQGLTPAVAVQLQPVVMAVHRVALASSSCCQQLCPCSATRQQPFGKCAGVTQLCTLALSLSSDVHLYVSADLLLVRYTDDKGVYLADRAARLYRPVAYYLAKVGAGAMHATTTSLACLHVASTLPESAL